MENETKHFRVFVEYAGKTTHVLMSAQKTDNGVELSIPSPESTDKKFKVYLTNWDLNTFRGVI